MEKCDARGLYITGMPKLYEYFYVMNRLLDDKHPETFKHMKLVGLNPSMYTPQWIMTVFTSNLPMQCIVRIWDCIFSEGNKIIYRIYLGIIKLHKRELKKLDLEHMIDRIRTAID